MAAASHSKTILGWHQQTARRVYL